MDATKLSYTVPEAASAIGVSPRTIYRLLESGELSCVKIGARTLIKREALEGLLEAAS